MQFVRIPPGKALKTEAYNCQFTIMSLLSLVFIILFINTTYFFTSRGLSKTQLLRFTDGSFVKNGENILISGQTGVGKNYIASAPGHQACSHIA